MPQVRVMERQPSGQFRVIGGTPGGVRVMESPYSTMRVVTGDRSQQDVPIRMMSAGGQNDVPIHMMSGAGQQVISIPSQPSQASGYRIRFVPGEDMEAPSSPQVYVSGGSSSGWPSQPASQHLVYAKSEPAVTSSTPATRFHTISRSSRTDSPDGTYRGQFQYPASHLSNIGRSSSDGSTGRFVVNTSGTGGTGGTGGAVYSGGPGGLSFSVSGSGRQPSQSNDIPSESQRPVYYVRTDSHDPSRRGSSPRVQVLRIQEALDSRRQRPTTCFDDIIQKKLNRFIKGQNPQYSFCTSTEGEKPQPEPKRETAQPQTNPGQDEYIYMARSHGGEPRNESPSHPRHGSPDSPASTLTPGKKIVRTTREEIRDLGDGQTQTVRETNEELVDDDKAKTVIQPDVIPVQSTPVIHADNIDTWKSTSSNDSGTGSGDKNLFNKFRFKFDSIGNFGRSDSRESITSNEALRFQDFDDMVGHMSHLNVPLATGAPKHLIGPTGSICPYCKNTDPGNVNLQSYIIDTYITLTLNY